ncbi:periplasmic heavy metal sensor [Sneathiella sp. HT1-7]|uniref:periplasmic heavy metal sensor n=1 Tax=Sneathiella sp. HT1-7 TaxID=2887192 RepID=UPI001D143B2D|nr:periplasmic heavy metal sensor [Sneathiella sp. HT1-7]MCC3304185.1 periplasmic heavy metal sensor [Sneathiella sp. HT1-7]
MKISRQKFLSAALILSVAVNILIGGFVVTQWIDLGPDKRHGDRFHFDRHAAVAVLDDKQREELKDFWKERRKNIRPYFKEFREYRDRLAELFSAKELDLVAINQTYADMIAKQLQIESYMQASMLELAKSLPDGDRAAFFKEGFHPPKRPSKMKKEDRE